MNKAMTIRVEIEKQVIGLGGRYSSPYDLLTNDMLWAMQRTIPQDRNDCVVRIVLAISRASQSRMNKPLRGGYNPIQRIVFAFDEEKSFRQFVQLEEGIHQVLDNRWSLGIDVRRLFNEVRCGLDEGFDQGLEASGDFVWLLTNPYSDQRAGLLITEGIALTVLKSFV